MISKIKYIILSIIIISIITLIINTYPKINKEKKNTLNNKESKCTNPKKFSLELNDSVHQYIQSSYLLGIRKNLINHLGIDTLVNRGLLDQINNTKTYIVDSLKHSYAFLTPNSKKLLTNISVNFQQKLKNTNLKKTKIIVTSILRTKESINRLRKRNQTAIKHSAHLHGTTFDITCSKFYHNKKISLVEIESLKEILAKVLFDLRKQNMCWVTFEKYQSCFHIVSK